MPKCTSRGGRISLAVVILLGLLALPGCGCRLPEEHKVAPPPRDAPPEEVVRTYFAAIAGRDKETARALLVPEARDDELEFESPDSPFQNWVSVDDVQIEGPEKDQFCQPGDTCVKVYVSFDLLQCEPVTRPDGPWSEPFGLRLVDGRWLIIGHGQG